MSLHLISCKKDKDVNSKPDILSFTVSSSVFATTDTIPYTIIVEDDELVKYISLYIADKNYNPVTPSQHIEINEVKKTVSELYTFSNRYLDESAYYFVCAAADESGITREYLSIQILPLQKAAELFLIMAFDNNIYKAGVLNNTYDSVDFKIQLDSKPVDFIFNGYSRQLAILYENGTLKAFSYPEFDEIWNYSGLNNPSVTYNSTVRINDNLVCCGNSYGSVLMFDEYGTIRKNVKTSGSDQVTCKKYVIINDLLISFNKSYGTGYTHLAVSSYTAGGVISEYQTILDVKDITGYQYPYALIWTETGVYTFNYENPILYQIGTYPDPPFLQAIAVNNTEFLCLNSLNTYLYYPVTNVWTIQNFTGGESICYENISQTTLVIKGQSIYSYISSQLIKEKAFSFLPIKISPVYNK